MQPRLELFLIKTINENYKKKKNILFDIIDGLLEEKLDGII